MNLSRFAPVSALLVSASKNELAQQGHTLTGKGAGSIRTEVTEQGEAFVRVAVYGEDYLLTLNYGVPAGRIPFTPGSGRGGQSRYITGLIDYWKRRGASDKEAKQRAFRTANSQSKYGSPTPASLRFSKTGKRTGWIPEMLEHSRPQIRTAIVPVFREYYVDKIKSELRKAGIKVISK